MKKIKQLSEIHGFLFDRIGDPGIIKEIDLLFKTIKPIYRDIVKYYWYDENEFRKAFNIKPYDYYTMKNNIITDVNKVIERYYLARELQFMNKKNVVDITTYKRNKGYTPANRIPPK